MNYLLLPFVHRQPGCLMKRFTYKAGWFGLLVARRLFQLSKSGDYQTESRNNCEFAHHLPDMQLGSLGLLAAKVLMVL
jgi:hypothetical protein